MTAWRLDLICGDQLVGGVDIKQGVFQGNSLSLLLFVLCLIPKTKTLYNSESA